MKSLMIVAAFFVVAFSAGAQTTPAPMTPQEFYERCGHVCHPGLMESKSARFRGAEAQPAAMMMQATTQVPSTGGSPTTSTAAGDEVYAYFRSSTGEVARRGEEVKLYLDVVKPYDRPVSIYGRRAKLNDEGNWGNPDYFSAEGGDGGWFPSLRTGQFSILAYSGKVSGDNQVGDGFDFDVVIADAQTGQLLQQAFTGFRVGMNSSKSGRGFNYLDRATLVGEDANSYVTLEGSIPTWGPLAVEFKAPDSFMVNVPVPALTAPNIPVNIRQLQLKLGVFNPATTTVDVVMVIVGARRHYTLPKAFLVTGSPNVTATR